jgi:hypothetical protein
VRPVFRSVLLCTTFPDLLRSPIGDYVFVAVERDVTVLIESCWTNGVPDWQHLFVDGGDDGTRCPDPGEPETDHGEEVYTLAIRRISTDSTCARI